MARQHWLQSLCQGALSPVVIYSSSTVIGRWSTQFPAISLTCLRKQSSFVHRYTRQYETTAMFRRLCRPRPRGGRVRKLVLHARLCCVPADLCTRLRPITSRASYVAGGVRHFIGKRERPEYALRRSRRLKGMRARDNIPRVVCTAGTILRRGVSAWPC
jgi:hypothetical protein